MGQLAQTCWTCSWWNKADFGSSLACWANNIGILGILMGTLYNGGAFHLPMNFKSAHAESPGRPGTVRLGHFNTSATWHYGRPEEREIRLQIPVVFTLRLGTLGGPMGGLGKPMGTLVDPLGTRGRLWVACCATCMISVWANE